jgi:hypothetical protein
MALNKYIAMVQRFARDQKQQNLDIGNLAEYINRARREIAMRAQCIRIQPPIFGSIEGWKITNGGTGYSTTPTLTITPPDFASGQIPNPNGRQATATAIVSGGVITSIFSQDGGIGYFQPIMTITDTTGKNATATPIMSPMNLLLQGQERYDFANIDLSNFPGVDSILFVRGVSILYANYRYSLPCYAWSVYESAIRQYPLTFQYVPMFFSQFGQGAAGSLFFYPLPSQTYQMEWDCCVLPSDLIDDQSVEALPAPWTDAIPYFGAAMAFEEMQNLNAARYFHEQFDRRVLGYSNYARVGRAVNPYGRYVLPFILGGLELLQHMHLQLTGMFS